MFPYPSGAGLHVGHPEGYTATDILARYRRMRGDNVMHPMGWDAFGLPAEQYAIETGTHPRDTTQRNIDTFRRQTKTRGFSYDWDREVDTTDPNYFRWTQWIFLQLYKAWYDPRIQRARPIAELERELAQEICARFPVEQVRFGNSGTEATMHAIRLARGVTGRDKVLKMEGAYHGVHDTVMVSVKPKADAWGDPKSPNPVPASGGVPAATLQNTLIAPFHDLAAAEKIFGAPGRAAVLDVRIVGMAAADIGANLAAVVEFPSRDVDNARRTQPVLRRQGTGDHREAPSPAGVQELAERAEPVGQQDAVDPIGHVGVLVAHMDLALRLRVLGDAGRLQQHLAQLRRFATR